jgi:hypothetical protein
MEVRKYSLLHPPHCGLNPFSSGNSLFMIHTATLYLPLLHQYDHRVHTDMTGKRLARRILTTTRACLPCLHSLRSTSWFRGCLYRCDKCSWCIFHGLGIYYSSRLQASLFSHPHTDLVGRQHASSCCKTFQVGILISCSLGLSTSIPSSTLATDASVKVGLGHSEQGCRGPLR